jgi:hypothetical protein
MLTVGHQKLVLHVETILDRILQLIGRIAYLFFNLLTYTCLAFDGLRKTSRTMVSIAGLFTSFRSSLLVGHSLMLCDAA